MPRRLPPAIPMMHRSQQSVTDLLTPCYAGPTWNGIPAGDTAADVVPDTRRFVSRGAAAIRLNLREAQLRGSSSVGIAYENEAFPPELPYFTTIWLAFCRARRA